MSRPLTPRPDRAPRRPAKLHAAIAAVLFGVLGTTLPALAHDTWFEPAEDASPGQVEWRLGTGNRFPKLESGIDAQYLRAHGCRRADGTPLSLRPLGDEPTALRLRVVPPDGAALAAPAPGALDCWAQLAPFDIALQPALVAVYLDEVRAPPAVRARWADIAARGGPWQERYTKHARTERGGAVPTPADAPPVMSMDIRRLAPAGVPRPGDTIEFEVRDGDGPLAGFDVELHGDRSAIGFWARTDDSGRVRLRAPLTGRWILRGTLLRPGTQADTWDSGFVTYTFDVAR